MSSRVIKPPIYLGIVLSAIFPIWGCGKAHDPVFAEKPSLNADTAVNMGASPSQSSIGLVQDANPSSSPIEGIFKLGHQLSKQADAFGQELLGLDEEECQRIGNEANRAIGRDMKLESGGAEVERVRALVMKVARQRKRTSEPLKVYLVDRPEINAFAHVGGYVYIYKGLVKKLKKESELCFVLAHEVGHLELGHCKALVTYSARAKQLTGDVGTLAQVAYSMVSVGYSEDCEYDADEWGAKAIEILGYTRVDAVEALKLICGENQANRIKKTKIPTSPLDELAGQIDGHFQTHPEIGDRIARLEKKTR